MIKITQITHRQNYENGDTTCNSRADNLRETDFEERFIHSFHESVGKQYKSINEWI